MPAHLYHTRGRGLLLPAAWLLPLLVLAACSREPQSDTASSSRVIAGAARTGGNGSVDAQCLVLPDTSGEFDAAQVDRNDFPLTQLLLDATCPRLTVLGTVGVRLERSYRLTVDAGTTLTVRARGEDAPVTIAFDVPATPRDDRSNVASTVVDSLLVTERREVTIRVMPVPPPRAQLLASRVLLSVVARPDGSR